MLLYETFYPMVDVYINIVENGKCFKLGEIWYKVATQTAHQHEDYSLYSWCLNTQLIHSYRIKHKAKDGVSKYLYN